MPLYQYRCGNCNHLIEVQRSYQERETSVLCTLCTFESTRVYSTPTIVFKGTGFYKTDNK